MENKNDLISRKAVINLLCELHIDNIAVNDKRVTEYIKELPVAYDIEELLKEMAMYKRSTRIDANGDRDNEWAQGRYRGTLDMAEMIKMCFKNDKAYAEMMKALDLLHL